MEEIYFAGKAVPATPPLTLDPFTQPYLVSQTALDNLAILQQKARPTTASSLPALPSKPALSLPIKKSFIVLAAILGAGLALVLLAFGGKYAWSTVRTRQTQAALTQAALAIQSIPTHTATNPPPTDTLTPAPTTTPTHPPTHTRTFTPNPAQKAAATSAITVSQIITQSASLPIDFPNSGVVGESGKISYQEGWLWIEDNGSEKGFICVDITNIPDTKKVKSAIYSNLSFATAGDINHDDLLLDSVDIGDGLDATDFAKSGYGDLLFDGAVTSFWNSGAYRRLEQASNFQIALQNQLKFYCIRMWIKRGDSSGGSVGAQGSIEPLTFHVVRLDVSFVEP